MITHREVIITHSLDTLSRPQPQLFGFFKLNCPRFWPIVQLFVYCLEYVELSIRRIFNNGRMELARFENFQGRFSSSSRFLTLDWLASFSTMERNVTIKKICRPIFLLVDRSGHDRRADHNQSDYLTFDLNS